MAVCPERNGTQLEQEARAEPTTTERLLSSTSTPNPIQATFCTACSISAIAETPRTLPDTVLWAAQRPPLRGLDYGRSSTPSSMFFTLTPSSRRSSSLTDLYEVTTDKTDQRKRSSSDQHGQYVCSNCRGIRTEEDSVHQHHSNRYAHVPPRRQLRYDPDRHTTQIPPEKARQGPSGPEDRFPCKPQSQQTNEPQRNSSHEMSTSVILDSEMDLDLELGLPSTTSEDPVVSKVESPPWISLASPNEDGAPAHADKDLLSSIGKWHDGSEHQVSDFFEPESSSPIDTHDDVNDSNDEDYQVLTPTDTISEIASVVGFEFTSLLISFLKTLEPLDLQPSMHATNRQSGSKQTPGRSEATPSSSRSQPMTAIDIPSTSSSGPGNGKRERANQTERDQEDDQQSDDDEDNSKKGKAPYKKSQRWTCPVHRSPLYAIVVGESSTGPGCAPDGLEFRHLWDHLMKAHFECEICGLKFTSINSALRHSEAARLNPSMCQLRLQPQSHLSMGIQMYLSMQEIYKDNSLTQAQKWTAWWKVLHPGHETAPAGQHMGTVSIDGSEIPNLQRLMREQLTDKAGRQQMAQLTPQQLEAVLETFEQVVRACPVIKRQRRRRAQSSATLNLGPAEIITQDLSGSNDTPMSFNNPSLPDPADLSFPDHVGLSFPDPVDRWPTN